MHQTSSGSAKKLKRPLVTLRVGRTITTDGRIVPERRLDKSCVVVGPIKVNSVCPVRVSAWKPTGPDDDKLFSLTGTEFPTEAGLVCQPSSQMGANGWVVDYGQAVRPHNLVRCNEVQASDLYRMSVAQAVACCFARPWSNADVGLADWKRACVMYFVLETPALGNGQLDSDSAAIPTVGQHEALPISCLAFSCSCGYKGVVALDLAVKQAYPKSRELWRPGGELDGASENSGRVLMMAPSSLAVVECFRAVMDNHRPLILSGWNIELCDLMRIAHQLVSTESRRMMFDYSRLSGSGDARARLPHLVLDGWRFTSGSSKCFNQRGVCLRAPKGLIADCMKLMRLFGGIEVANKKLATVAKAVTGRGKVDDMSHLLTLEELAKLAPAGRRRLYEYWLADAQISLDICQARQMTECLFSTSWICHSPIEFMASGMVGKAIECLVIRSKLRN